ncbi:PAS domain-containing protein [Kamptonema cortianum]|nr:PAS domain-containing protein [Geitlerinema splendidum]MDK3160386.1 PAS domain-containing protein [Kamptonema cortianum]
MRILDPGDQFRRMGGPDAGWRILEIQDLLKAARESWRESVGRSPDGILVLNADLRVQAVDSGGAALVGENPSDILLSQVFRLFDANSHEMIERRLAKPSSKPIETLTTSGEPLSIRLLQKDGQSLVGLWVNHSNVTEETPSVLPTQPHVSLDWSSLHTDLAICQSLRDITDAVQRFAAMHLPGSRGFLAVPQGDEMAVVATWPASEPCVAKLRFAQADSMALRSGRPARANSYSSSAEPFLIAGERLNLVPCYCQSAMVGMIGSSGDFELIQKFAQVVGSHLWRFIR